jgi:hypothetical protein
MAKQNSSYNTFDRTFGGKLVTGIDPITIGEEDFQTLKNMRYKTTRGIQGVSGMTKINAAAFSYTDVTNGFHFRKDNTSENHVLVQTTSGNNSKVLKSDSSAAIPNQDTFSDFLTLSSGSPAYFSTAPDDSMVICDGTNNYIWGGNEARCAAFINYTPNNSFYYDFTQQMGNTLTDSKNIATLKRTTSAIDSSTKALWHFDSALTDSSGNSHTLTGVGTPTYTAGRFGKAINLDGSTQFVYVADHADFNFSANTYTIDLVVKVDSLSAIRPLYYQQITDNTNSFCFYIDTTGSVNLVVKKTGETNYSAATDAGTISAGTEYHIELVQSLTDLYIFVDGVVAYYGTAPTIIQDYTGNINIGWDGTNRFDGYIDELRVSLAARNTSNFAVPLSAYGSVTETYLYVASIRPLSQVKFYILSGNTSDAVASCYEWNGSGWSIISGLVDGTLDSGGTKTLNQTGSISFTSTVNTSKIKYESPYMAYFYQFVFTGLDDNVTISYCTTYMPPQPPKDIWDGIGRTCYQFQIYKTTYDDNTVNIGQADYDESTPITYAAIGSLTSSQCVYAGFLERLQGIYIGLPDSTRVNTIANTVIRIYYWNGSAWVSVGAINDGTSVKGVSFKRSGEITWNAPDQGTEFVTTTGNNVKLYYYKISFSKTLSSSVRVDYVYGIAAQTEILAYRYPVQWQGRLWLLNQVNGKKNAATCSYFNTVCTFNGSNVLTCLFGSSDEIVGGATLFTRYGGNIYDNLIVIKRNEIFLMDGTGPSDWKIYQISTKKGCVAPLTIKKCDTSYEITQGLTKHVIIWQGSEGIHLFDGNSIITISDDIEDMFDPNSSTYIGTDVDGFSGEYDPVRGEYHWFAGTREMVYSLSRKAWFEIDRGTGKKLISAWNVIDSIGNSYLYGGTSDGYIERLENGTTFDGNSIVYTVRTGDTPIAAKMEYLTEVRNVKLVGVAKNTTTATVAFKHYIDTALAGTSIKNIAQSSSARRCFFDVSSFIGAGTTHSFEYIITTNNETIGFEPLTMSGLWKAVRNDFLGIEG